MDILERINEAPILGIRRHRLLGDGSGVRTLIGFYGCPLSCKYCLNPECHDVPSKADFRSVQELLEVVKVDDLYFMATGGGVTFGGGEPLLYADFISDFINTAPKTWSYSCETSLNVEESKFRTVISLMDEFIVDVKDISPPIYHMYTAADNVRVLSNLRLAAQMNLCDKFKIRLPLISGYNCLDDVKVSKDLLEEMGFLQFENLTYVTQIQQEKTEENERLYNGMNWGKVTCEVLKRIRTEIANHYGIPFYPNTCTEKICHTGTCPVCENELEKLTRLLSKSLLL